MADDSDQHGLSARDLIQSARSMAEVIADVLVRLWKLPHCASQTTIEAAQEGMRAATRELARLADEQDDIDRERQYRDVMDKTMARPPLSDRQYVEQAEPDRLA